MDSAPQPLSINSIGSCFVTMTQLSFMQTATGPPESVVLLRAAGASLAGGFGVPSGGFGPSACSRIRSTALELGSFSVELLLLLFFVAAIAGFIDTLAGGGGLIAIPALIMSGVPPLAALATNKLQGSMGTATSAYMMIRNRKVHWDSVKYLMLAAFIGSVIGTLLVQLIDTQVLSFVIPLVLLFIAAYFVLSPMPALNSAEARLSNGQYRTLVVPFIGCYDGMFGPGTGSFFALSGVSCRGHDLITSTAQAKPLNFATNVASLMVFLIAGHIVWAVGLTMMLGQALGAWLGSHCLFRINPVYLRGIVVLMCCGMLAKYAHSMGWLDFTN